MFTALETILLILFVPETAYIRDRRYEIDELTNDNLSELAAVERRHAGGEKEKDSDNDIVRIETRASATPTFRPKKTFLQEMSVFNGTFSDDNLFQLLIAPFAVCSNIAIL